MLCEFCRSSNLKVLHTDSKNETLNVKQNKLNDKYELQTVDVMVSATRRKVKCLNCGIVFWTVEHFEKLTNSRENRKCVQPDFDFSQVIINKPMKMKFVDLSDYSKESNQE